MEAYLFKDLNEDVLNHFENVLDDICTTSSERERASMECEREVDDMKMAEYMEEHLDEYYEGIVSGVRPNMLFVQLPNLIEGAVRLSDLKEVFYYDEETECVIGKNTKTIYTLGSKVKVKVIAANKDTRQIDFIIAKDEEVNYGEEKIKKIS